ncbi:hypothetical protein TH8_18170 [Thalassospira profundimaris]|nr:hypothetical protein TH8_18170 [Thalassospira profundimaris]
MVGMVLFVIAELFMTLVLLETVSEHVQAPGQFQVLTNCIEFQRLSGLLPTGEIFARPVYPPGPGKNDPVSGRPQRMAWLRHAKGPDKYAGAFMRVR